MNLSAFTAQQLYENVYNPHNTDLILDVRNDIVFSESKVEGPHASVKNISYIDFIEDEQECLTRLAEPKDRAIRVVCAKEGSAKYVGELLVNEGYQDVQYLKDGFLRWANLLVPKKIIDEDGYQLYQFIRPGKASCSYGLIYQGQLMLFDPAKNATFYTDFAASTNSKLVKSFETHLQADYVSGSPTLAKQTGASIIAHENDFFEAQYEYEKVTDGDVKVFDAPNSPEVRLVHTPGHTPGSTSYIINDKYLVSGDAVFIVSIGRPDLGGKAEEWAKLQYAALTEKIEKFDEQLIVLPGHYSEYTEADEDGIFQDTMGAIKQRNDHIYGLSSEAEFIRFIKDNMRQQPEVYAQIRLLNMGKLDKSEEEVEVMDTGKNECAASQK